MKHALIASLFASLIALPALAEGDPDKGEKIFKKCKACHQVGEGAKNRTGPVLNDLFGRPAGAADGYKYSKALMAKAEEGLVWDETTLAEFLAKPKKYIPKTKMSFAGLKKEKDVANLLAYLKQFSPDA